MRINSLIQKLQVLQEEGVEEIQFIDSNWNDYEFEGVGRASDSLAYINLNPCDFGNND